MVPGTYSYAQEAGAGLPRTPGPLEWGLPQCADDGGWDGYGSEEELAIAISQAPDEPSCADDPADTVSYVGAAMPGTPEPQRPGYFFNGPDTDISDGYEGGRADIEVINPDVTHPPPAGQSTRDYEFVSGHVLAADRQNLRYRFMQVGWTERSDAGWGDEQFIYWYDRRRDIPRKTRYRVRPGGFVSVRVRSRADGLAQAEILWKDVWRPIETSLNTYCTRVGPNCNIEVFLEVHSKDGSLPTLFGQATTFRKVMLRTAPSTWALWDSTFPTVQRQASPYVVCYEHQFYRFHVGRDLLC